MKLEERTMLVKLSIGQWSAKKTDREATKATIEQKKAAAGSGVFRKRLLGRNALSNISKVIGAARAAHYTFTLPWNDDGSRIITTEAYESYAKTMRDFRIKLQKEVEGFLKDYEELKTEAKASLSDLFNEDDYPDVKDIQSKFYMDVETTSLPNSRDFRAKVSDAEVKAITKDIERRTELRIKEALNDVWRRVADVTEKMSERLLEYDPGDAANEAQGIFRDSLVTNVTDLVEILPNLNISGDPRLDEIYTEMKKSLTAYDAQDLRVDKAARIATAKKAKRIHDKVAKYIM